MAADTVRVLFLIPRDVDGPAKEREEFLRAIALRDEIRDGLFEGARLVGPEFDTDPEYWSCLLRVWSDHADLVIVEGHGGCFKGPESSIAPEPEYAIGTDEKNWRPVQDQEPSERPRFGLVILGACRSEQHIERLARFFDEGQRLITSSERALLGDVERVYRPVISAMATGDFGDAIPFVSWGNKTTPPVEDRWRVWSSRN